MDEVSGLVRMIVCNLPRHIPHAAGTMDSDTPSSDPFHGLNPADLMAAAALPTDGGADTLPLSPRDLPALAEIAAAFPELEILDLIGHGGMSAVFRARQPKLDRVIALKVLPKSLAATPGFAERFTREGRVLARALARLESEMRDEGKSEHFDVLKPWLTAEADATPQSAVATKFGMSIEAVKVAVHRLRKRFREAVRAEIAQTVSDADTVREELDALMAALRK
jgi:hypothetical protein